MRKKKRSKNLTKQVVVDALQELFQAHPNQEYEFKQIFKALKLEKHPAKMLAVDVLEELTWDDFLIKPTDNTFKLNLKTQVQVGTFIRKANGKNSFQPDDGGKPIFVSERNSLFAMNGDRVKVSMMARREKHIREAMVTEILKRKHNQAVGILHVEKDFAFLVTDGSIFVHDILIPKKDLKGGRTGEKAVVKITQWPSKESKNLIGEVIDILGKQGINNVEMHAILAKYGLPYVYPQRVEKAANKLTGDISEEEIARREDFRDVLTFTIDPKDAKDFDDALSIRNLDENLYEVGVHIADVSYYVTENSVIDKEAQERATSVYLVDRTVPMLPERLCNFICSLRPNEEKLCYSVVFNMDKDANVLKWRLVHTIIKSNRRYAYEEVQEMLEGKEGDYAEELRILDKLAKKLRKNRFKDGAVKFDREELHFDIDEKGKPTRCYFKKSTDATRLIEEFMLLANRTVAEFVGTDKKPRGFEHKPLSKTFVYRIHDQPDPKKLEQLRQVVTPLGYRLKTIGSRSTISKSLNNLMEQASGSGEQKLIETVALRTMMKAKYSTHNIGHYGLAFEYYTHFTSPIRRYPDMMVHRLLSRYQEGGRSANQNYFEEQCEHSSDMEQTAQMAERESIKYKMVEFMEDKIGLEFDAHISGIQSYGLYCEIDENHCEGLIGMHDLTGDYYEFDERNYRLVGRRHHKTYRLGDPIRIKVARANVEKRQLDFLEAE